MLLRIMRHEWRTLVADRTVIVLLTVLGVALAGGLVNGVRWRAHQARVVADARQEETDRFARAEGTIRSARERSATLPAFSDPGNPDTAGRQLAARYAALPAGALMPLAIGQSDVLPQYVRVTTESRETVMATSDTSNPLQLLTGRFDAAFVVVYLYPLFILALSYNLLSAEREQGTLALALSQPISIAHLLAGKVAIRLAVLLGCVAVTAALASLAAGLPLWDGGVALRFAGWTLVVAVYGVFWMAVAVAVAVTGLSSSASAVLLSGLWLMLTVVLPSGAHLAVTVLHPVPSRVEMIQAMREASDEANAQGAALLGRYYQDHPELASAETSATDFNVVRLAVDAQVEESVAPVLSAFNRQLAAQQSLVDRLRVVSPAILVQDSLADLAGTGASRHQWFVQQVDAFHQGWREFFNGRVAGRARLEDYQQVPQFAFAEEQTGSVLRRTGRSVVSILLLTTLVVGVAVLRARRFDLSVR